MTEGKGKRKMATCARKRKHESTPTFTGINSRIGSRTLVDPSDRSMSSLEGDCEVPRIASVSCHVELQTAMLHKPSQNPCQIDADQDQNSQPDTSKESINDQTSWLESAVFNKSQGIQKHRLALESGNRSPRHEFLKTLLETEAEVTSDVPHSRSYSAYFPNEDSDKAVIFTPLPGDHASSEPALVAYLESDSNIRLENLIDIEDAERNVRRRQLKSKGAFRGDFAVNHEVITPQNRNGTSCSAHDATSASSIDQEYSTEEEQISSSTVVAQFARPPVLSGLKYKFSDVPSIFELEEFFEEHEKQSQKAFMTRYNFDPVNEVPLKGRFDWVRVEQ